MGHIFSRPPESFSGGAPRFRSPFSDITGPIGHHDHGPCLDFQLRFIDCLEAYGHVQGREKCKLMYQDFVECAQKWKQLKRVEVIKDYRDQQWFLGQIGKGPKVPLNSEHTPDGDFYAPNFEYEHP